MRISKKKLSITLPMILLATLLVSNVAALPSQSGHANTATPIQHVVIIFQENISFDHYFASYPVAANLKGEPKFTADPGTYGDFRVLLRFTWGISSSFSAWRCLGALHQL